MKLPCSCSDGCDCCPTGRGILLAELEADEDGPYLLELAYFMSCGATLPADWATQIRAQQT